MSEWLGLPVASETILQALKSIHPGLFVRRAGYALDHTTGEVAPDPITKEPIDRPRYWIWIDNAGRRSPLLPVETPEGEYMPLDMRTVRRIGTDLGIATDSIEELWAEVEKHEAKKEEARAESERERFRRWIENNKPAWRSAMQNARDGKVAPTRRMRDPVIYGYDGQAVRSSSLNTVPMSSRERGFDTPEN